ncbi:MAG: YkgJ family cysteine cluster protein [Candidatus Omnitrophota bacterium]
MPIESIANEVKMVFEDIDRDTAQFIHQTGMQCIDGCCHCCMRPDIEASPIEFLPLAFHLYSEGKAETFIEYLQNMGDPSFCPLLSYDAIEKKGLCKVYEYRPLICRLFGFSAMMDKNDQPALVTCEPIKTKQADIYRHATDRIREGLNVPVMKNYYFRLMGIHMNLALNRYPIQTAARMAIEEVLFYYLYR